MISKCEWPRRTKRLGVLLDCHDSCLLRKDHAWQDKELRMVPAVNQARIQSLGSQQVWSNVSQLAPGKHCTISRAKSNSGTILHRQLDIRQDTTDGTQRH